MWGEGKIEGEEERDKTQAIYVRIDRSSILVLMLMLLEWIGNRNGGIWGSPTLFYLRFCRNLRYLETFCFLCFLIFGELFLVLKNQSTSRRYLLRASSICSRWIPKLWGDWVAELRRCGVGWLFLMDAIFWGMEPLKIEGFVWFEQVFSSIRWNLLILLRLCLEKWLVSFLF